MKDRERMAREVERAEAVRARRIEREATPAVAGIDDARILSGIAEVALTVDGEVADSIALSLATFDFDTAARAIKLSTEPGEVLHVAERLREGERLARLRARARAGDQDAQRELAAAVEAMRRAVQD